MTFSILLSTILLVTSAVASPFVGGRDTSTLKVSSSPISLHVVTKLNAAGGMHNVIKNDKNRFQTLLAGKQRGKSNGRNGSGGGYGPGSGSGTTSGGANGNGHGTGSGSGTTSGGANGTGSGNGTTNGSGNVPVPLTDIGMIATVDIGVGSPPTTYQLIVDTGSSNTFVNASAKYIPTSSSKDTGDKVAVSYGSGFFFGEEYTDDVTLGNSTITSQSIGVAQQSEGFNGLDGILGLGPDDLTEGTLKNNPQSTIPTVTDNLAKQGKAAAPLVGVSFPLTTSSGNNGGSLDFGATDSSKFDGEVVFVPITTTQPSSTFWGIDQSITYGDESTQILKAGSGIVDTGTTLLYLATDAFQAYSKATGATLDQTTGLLKVDNPDNLKSLIFKMGDNTFEFTANAQMWPRSLNSEVGGDSSSTYLIVNDMGAPSGQGQDFINGFTFLQRFYSVFDTAQSRVGFANTSQTTATSN